jgi:hypothetical protein
MLLPRSEGGSTRS